jgi:hypothetical protein
MMKQIFYDGKKSCVDDQKLRDWTKWFVAILQYFMRKDTILSPHNLAFQLIKSKKKLQI